MKINIEDTEKIPAERIRKHFSDAGLGLPGEFISFLAEYSGGSGEVGGGDDALYVEFWKIGEILQLNEEYHVGEYLENIILFGSDGGDEAFGYDYIKNVYITVPFIGMGLTEEPEELGSSRKEFFEGICDLLG